MTDNKVGENMIFNKMKKTADLFVNKYKSEISIFKGFKNTILNN
ncbi:MAG: hypothetical protein BAJALOKI2v1_940007 [Promethearchaeota archaeon]|nr:MAG: hypothetical protein BAJALOKI2v1_940007 [Candidatus Lokiarchaeota archaeon]